MNISSDLNKRTDNTIRNIISGVTNKILALLIPFAIRTIIIYRLGMDYVGISSLFSSILQVLSVTELGFSSAIVFSMYASVANNDIGTIREQLRLYRTIYRIVGCIILTIGLALLPFIHFFIKGNYPDDLNIYLLYFIYLGNTVVSYLAYGYKNSILIVYQRNDIISKVDSIVYLIRGIIQISVLLLFGNYYIYILALPLFTIVSNIIINYLANKMHPELILDRGWSLKGIEKIKKQIGGIAIGRIGLVCRNSLDSIILSSLFGLIVTAIYSNYYYIFSAIISFVGIILTSMSASVGNSIVTKSIEQNENDHIRFDFYMELIIAFCTICLYCMYQPLMKLWAGENRMLSNSSMILFCVYFYVSGLSQVRSVYSEAAGLWWHFRYLSILELFANLILNILLGKLFGVNGILFATIITAFCCSFVGCTVITYKNLFKMSCKRYYFNNFRYILITVVGCFIIGIIGSVINVYNWRGLFVKLVFTVISASGYLIVIHSLNIHSRNYLKKIYLSLRNKIVNKR